MFCLCSKFFVFSVFRERPALDEVQVMLVMSTDFLEVFLERNISNSTVVDKRSSDD